MKYGEKAKKVVDEAVRGMNIVLEVTGNNRHFAVTDEAVYIGSVTQPTMLTKAIAPWMGLNGQNVKIIPLDAISTIKIHRRGMILMEFVVVGTPEIPDVNDLEVRIINENLIAFDENQLGYVQQVANQIMEMRDRKVAGEGKNTAEILENLAELRKAGVLSDTEYEEKKRILM